MTTATKKDFWIFSERFEYLMHPRLSCFHNGIKACVKVVEIADEVPRLIQVDFENLDDAHIYVVYGGLVYNLGMTDNSNKYPDLSLDELMKKGQDKTTELLSLAYDAFTGNQDTFLFRPLGYLIQKSLTKFKERQTLYELDTGRLLTPDEYYLALLERGIELSLQKS